MIKTKRQSGFTLLEIAVVISLVGIGMTTLSSVYLALIFQFSIMGWWLVLLLVSLAVFLYWCACMRRNISSSMRIAAMI